MGMVEGMCEHSTEGSGTPLHACPSAKALRRDDHKQGQRSIQVSFTMLARLLLPENTPLLPSGESICLVTRQGRAPLLQSFHKCVCDGKMARVCYQPLQYCPRRNSLQGSK